MNSDNSIKEFHLQESLVHLEILLPIIAKYKDELDLDSVYAKLIFAYDQLKSTVGIELKRMGKE